MLILPAYRSTMLTACVFVTRNTVRHPRRFVFGIFDRKPNCSWSEAFENRGLTVQATVMVSLPLRRLLTSVTTHNAGPHKLLAGGKQIQGYNTECTVHSFSCTGSLPGVKRPGIGVDHTHPPSTEFKGTVRLYIYSPSGSLWAVIRWPLPLPHLL